MFDRDSTYDVDSSLFLIRHANVIIHVELRSSRNWRPDVHSPLSYSDPAFKGHGMSILMK
jgi:hypothetical protein